MDEEDTSLEEELTSILVEIVAALDETVTERDILKGMCEQERKAKEALALELEDAMIKISRLKFYLENS